MTFVRCPAPPFSSLLRLVSVVDKSSFSPFSPFSFSSSFSSFISDFVSSSMGLVSGLGLRFGAFESSPSPGSSSFDVISDLIPSGSVFASAPALAAEPSSAFNLTGRLGDVGSAFAPLDFDGVVCLLKNDFIPSDRSDTGWIKVGDSLPTFPTSGGTG